MIKTKNVIQYTQDKKTIRSKFIDDFKKNYQLYILLLPALTYFVIFHFIPIYGVQIAFKQFIASKGILGSPWVGFEHFIRLFQSYSFWSLIQNTLGISLYQLIAGFPIPIILAISLNEVRNKYFKKSIQMISYAPHFISTVVLAGMTIIFLSEPNGIINKLIITLGGQSQNFMAEPEYFKSIYVLSGIWQNAGWGSVIYMASLSGIDTQIYEAAEIDGTSKLQKIWYIDIPSIMPTVITLLLLNMSHIMSVGFEKVFLLQNKLNMSTSDVISTYVYRVGLVGGEYSFSAATGLFNSVISLLFILIMNRISKKVTETSLW